MISVSVNQNEEKRVEQLKKEEKKISRDSFSRASDFALLLLIPVSFTVYYLVHHFFASQNVPAPITYSPWFDRFYAFDTSLWAHAFSLGLLFFGLGSALAGLHGIDRLREWEEKNEAKPPYSPHGK